MREAPRPVPSAEKEQSIVIRRNVEAKIEYMLVALPLQRDSCSK